MGTRKQPRKLQFCIQENLSNRVSDFRDFVCSLFPKAILFDFHVWRVMGDISGHHVMTCYYCVAQRFANSILS